MLPAPVSMKNWELGFNSSAFRALKVSPAAQTLGAGKGQGEGTSGNRNGGLPPGVPLPQAPKTSYIPALPHPHVQPVAPAGLPHLFSPLDLLLACAFDQAKMANLSGLLGASSCFHRVLPKRTWLCLSAWAVVVKDHRLGLNNRNVFSQFWRLELQDQVLGGLVLSEAFLLGLQTAVFSLCPQLLSALYAFVNLFL